MDVGPALGSVVVVGGGAHEVCPVSSQTSSSGLPVSSGCPQSSSRSHDGSDGRCVQRAGT